MSKKNVMAYHNGEQGYVLICNQYGKSMAVKREDVRIVRGGKS